MTFAQRLQAFIDLSKKDGPFDPIDMIRAFLIQLAASAAVASERSGEPLDKILDSMCKNLRETAYRCQIIDQRQKGN